MNNISSYRKNIAAFLTLAAIWGAGVFVFEKICSDFSAVYWLSTATVAGVSYAFSFIGYRFFQKMPFSSVCLFAAISGLASSQVYHWPDYIALAFAVLVIFAMGFLLFSLAREKIAESV